MMRTIDQIPPAGAGSSVVHSPLAEPFVGRDAELAALGRLASRATDGHGQVALITGSAGLGKTALVSRALVAGPLTRVVAASGDADERSLTGGLLDQLARAAVAEAPGHRQIADAAARLRDLVGAGAADPLSAGPGLLGLVETVTAGPGPVALVADDAQWSDDLSLRALSFAVRRLAAHPVLCIIIVRSEDLPELPAGLRRSVADRGTRLDLGPLSPPEVARLAELAGAGRLSRRAAQRLTEHTEGVPLHVRELLRDLPAAALRVPGAALPAPRSLGTLVLSRLATCAPQTERLVVAAAVLGLDSRLADVAALAGLADPLPALQEAASVRILEPAGAAERRCAFGHALIRAVVYRDIGASRRAELHRGAARLTTGEAALAHRTAGCRGADPALAADLRERAGTELAAGHRAEAAEHLLTAVQVAGPGPARDELLLAAVGQLADLGDVARARAYQAEVAALPPSAARSVVLSRLAMLAGEYGPAETWLAAAREALVPARPPGESEVREQVAVAACQLALMMLAQQRPEDAAGWAGRANDIAVNGFTRACTCAVRGGCLASVGSAGEACALLRAELARQESGPGAALIRVSLAALLARCDDLPGARGQLAAAHADGGFARLPMAHQLESTLIDVDIQYWSGAWDQASAGAERLVALLEDLDQEWLLPSACLLAACVAAGRGDGERAARHEAAAARPRGGGPGASPVELAGARTALAVARDDPAAVVAAVEVLDLGELSEVDPGRLLFWPAYAAALVRVGRPETAEPVLAGFEELARTRQRRSALAAAARARGSLEAARQRPEAARRAFEASLARLRELGMPQEEAQTRLDYGRFLRRAGQRRAALRELSAARWLFAGLGARPFAERCDAELGQEPPAGAGPASVWPAAQVPLTARQLAVARAVASGKSNREVAGELYITVKTVEFHMSQILVRLGVDSRAEIAAALAYGAVAGRPG
ncbi:MAG TPA: AAA family ATPase [Streptosporangiaceae bacterium]|jgi:DNA-binding CsgD family transcriptional regulator|nr:AAA family ATPase [Streptosporangiaceae bacterium]